MSTLIQPTLFDRTSAAERIGTRINTVQDERVRASLWVLWIYAVGNAAEPKRGLRSAFFLHRMVPLINRLDPAGTLYRSDAWQRDGRPPQLVHRCPQVPDLLWALRQLAFGYEAEALAALEGVRL